MSSQPAGARRSRTVSSWRLVSGVCLIGLLAVGASWAVWYRGTYHLWPGQSIPARIHWCGRDYDRGSGKAVSYAEVVRLVGATPETVMTLPPAGPRHALVAAATEQEVRRRNPGADGCATLVFLRLEASRYLTYELSGGL